MQDAAVVLSILEKKSRQNSNYIFDRLYRNLFNSSFYVFACNTINAQARIETPGARKKRIDLCAALQVEELISSLKREAYHPTSLRRMPIPPKTAVRESFSASSLSDKLVQEIIRVVLQAIYEPVFKDVSHGFRPNRDVHTALHQLRSECKGTNWVISGDIEDFFALVPHKKLLEVLSRKISDGRFLNLIDRFLKAGYMENWQRRCSFSGVSSGEIIGPILANIYFHELDVFMEQLCERYTTKGILPFDQPGRGQSRVRYIRYAGNFVVMLSGNRDLAVLIQSELSAFFCQELQLGLSQEKILVTNLLDQNVRFLGYDIARARKNGVITQYIQLLVPGDVVREKLLPFVANGKAIRHNARVNISLVELLQRYNADIQGFYDYYCLASNVSAEIGRFKYYHYASLLKTVAHKEKCSVARVIKKYGVDVQLKQGTGTKKIFALSYQTREGVKTITYFNEQLKMKTTSPL